MAKIVFERSGGFLEPPIDLTLDLDSLAPHEAQHFMYLIEDADFFRFPEDLVTDSTIMNSSTPSLWKLATCGTEFASVKCI